MAFPKAISVALSTAALAGFTALAAGAATPANAQTTAASSWRSGTVLHCDWRFGNCQQWGAWQQPVQPWQQPVQVWQPVQRPWFHHHHHGFHHHHYGPWGR
ncbi:hypothetical protein [Actinomadura alba]|uniref:Uncharacterized protein n=1 Tax=Actinomadura alba TaxID=406431 RepID=A0ABR7LNM2_9ACTN|nr:hypothetical protein [Actinomadura alba]MBC6466442.1 hypothetical protein [Actinomadura alba]